MEKVVISSTDVAAIGELAPDPKSLAPKLPPAIPWWSRAALAVFVFVLPLLCLVAVILRISIRNQSPRTKHAVTAYLSTLLIISGLITSVGIVGALSIVPQPAIGNMGLSELDERTEFPRLPAARALSGAEVSRDLKPLVVVITPGAKLWFGAKTVVPSNSFGAGLLLHADLKGYLFVTARHVVAEPGAPSKFQHVLLAGLSGVWATADIIGIHQQLDLALLWIPRHAGKGNFVQSLSTPKDGESIFVIGHPQGLRYSLSSGMISREDGSVIQISAPISPGNSGGPVFDDLGNLLGIVTGTIDKGVDPNAENLNFAVSSDALRNASGWQFSADGRQRFDSLLKASAEIPSQSP
jgi:S1-C subfamily serine protease